MSLRDAILLAFKIMGGLAIFLLGMSVMSEGLKNAIGSKLQPLLSKTTKNRLSGLGLGTALGSAVHSGPTIVMLLGFVNAGLMTLEQTIAPMMGANIGTTLAMQAVSFKITDYCFVFITVGLVLSLALSTTKGKGVGRSILGFGLLFLGMTTMSGSITPHKALFAQYLQGIDGTTLGGVLIGVAVSAILTAIWQSSGATIAMVFALVSAGVFTDISQVLPIVLGTQIGKCITALMGSLGTNIEARRVAIAPILFNVFSVVIGILARPLFYYLIPMTSSDLLRQTANLNTAVMAVGAFLLLPFCNPFARLVRKIVSPNAPMPESSYLDYKLLEYPERALVAVISELQRVAKLCSSSLFLTAHVILHKHDKETIARIKMNEQVIDDIKLATREYLLTNTKKYLSRRQIIMTHHLNRCMIDIERIGDHIDQLCDLSLKRPHDVLDKESFDWLFLLYEKANKIVSMVIDSMNPAHEDFQTAALHILEARDEYLQYSLEIKDNFLRKVETHQVSSIAAVYFNEYVSVLDRMIRHIESIALAEKHEDFWIKQSKLDKKPKQLCDTPFCHDINPMNYLEKLNA